MGETDHRKDVLQGTLDLLILDIIVREPMHGWDVMRRLRELMSARSLRSSPISITTSMPASPLA